MTSFKFYNHSVKIIIFILYVKNQSLKIKLLKVIQMRNGRVPGLTHRTIQLLVHAIYHFATLLSIKIVTVPPIAKTPNPSIGVITTAY